jgi:spore germination protein GerM
VIARRTVAYGAPLLAALAGSAIYMAPRYYNATATRAAVAPAETTPAAPGRKIKARLFYVNEDGTRLTSVERDVAYSEGAAEQAREIIAAQLGPVAEPLVSAIPAGTTLRAVFVTEKGQAFVDLSREVVTAHPGGTLSELLTVYTVVNALTTNLPAVTSVQVLVDGKEVETLAGHIDLRRPLEKNVAWVQ